MPSSSPPTSPRVSVVVPTHRRPALLRKTLESLEAQTFAKDQFDVTVVATENDDAFTLVDEFKRRNVLNIRCVSVPNDPLAGKSASVKRNHGVAITTGPWIAMIDDDCVASPDWITGAAAFFEDPRAGGIEGKKEIPTPPKMTVTYKGLLMFTRPGGYQTCNMFYRRDVFQQVGGFDLHFPFYLEDSDIAWSVLDAGFAIPFAERAVVYHPVTDARPWRMLADAQRASLMPYLFKKHRARYTQSGTKVLRGSHWIYLLLYASLAVSLGMKAWVVAAAVACVTLALVGLHAFSMFRGCSFSVHEFLVTALLLPVSPVVKWVQLIKGNLKHKVWLWT